MTEHLIVPKELGRGPALGKPDSPATGLSITNIPALKCDSPQPTTNLDNFLDADWCHFPSGGWVIVTPVAL
jgi:hypothetical protein